MSIEVHVRIRPNVPNSVWSSAETVLYSTNNPNTRYVYNKVHHIGTSNENLFHGIEPLVHAGFDGKNVTVMAYGQTGSGKTHSMNGTEADPGIVHRTAKLLLDLKRNFAGTQIVVYFTEIYNESVKDLLEPRRGDLALHDAPDGGVFFDKKSMPIESLDDFLRLQGVAERNRKYGVTNLNDHSSRSHMILTFEIQRANNRQLSTINLVDLAGSESASRANTEGMSLREGGFINKSLLTLGNVVDAIVDKRSYVPYRDAKLTRILRNCLGGSGMTFILCCINPSQENFEQTVASLRFTQRAMKIKNDPVMVLNMPPLFTHQYKAGVEELVHGFHELCDAFYQHGLRDSFVYTNSTMSSIVSHFDGQVSDSLNAMSNTQRLLIAHDHALAIDQVGRLYNRLHEVTCQCMQSKEVEKKELKRQRDAAEEIECRQAKIARMEVEVKEKASDADAELAGWEYQLYEARQRRILPLELLLASERSKRCRIQYEWSVCMERIAARCVPTIMSMDQTLVLPVADKQDSLQQMQQRLQQAREELAELAVAHDMIKGDLQEMRQAVEDSTATCATSSQATSLSPQPRPYGAAIDADGLDSDIDRRIHELEREERVLRSQAVYVARCESARRLRVSLKEQRSNTPPTSRSAVRRCSQSALQEGRAPPVGGDFSPKDARHATGCYASPPQPRSPTPRTARAIFSSAEPLPNREEPARPEKSVSPRGEQLADGVRRALGLLRDVRSKLLRPAQGRRCKANDEGSYDSGAGAAVVTSATLTEAPRLGSRRSRSSRRTVSHAPVNEDVEMALANSQHEGLKEAQEPVLGIAARRRMENAPLRPNLERALWRLSQSPVNVPVETKERSRSHRR